MPDQDWFSANSPSTEDWFASSGEPEMATSHNPETPDKRTWTDTAVDALPMVGGSIGGLVGMVGGPVGAAAGAALGGAGGESYRRLIQGVRGKRNLAQDSPLEAAGGIALEGGKQAAAEAVGGAVGRGLTKVAPRLYRGLLKPSTAVEEGFGGDKVVRTLIDEGVTISDKGAKKIGGRLSGSRAAALGMVDAADSTAAPIDVNELTSSFQPVIAELKKRAAIGQADETGRVAARVRGLTRTTSKPGGLGLKEAQGLKETAQRSAKGAYRQMRVGAKSELSADDLLNEATASGFQKALENRVKGLGEQNAATQAFLGGNMAIRGALRRGKNNLGVGGARDLIAAGVGGSIGGMAGGPAGGLVGASAGLLTRLMASPRSGSAIAIGLDRTGKKIPIDDLIRALHHAAREPQE